MKYLIAPLLLMLTLIQWQTTANYERAIALHRWAPTPRQVITQFFYEIAPVAHGCDVIYKRALHLEH